MSYWCDEKLAVRVTGPAGEQEISLDQPFALIGSHARAHIVLSGPEVRKRALLLVAIEGGIYVAYLDVEQADPDARGRWLTDGEAIQLGPYTLHARLASGQALQLPSAHPQNQRSPVPIPVLHIYCGALLKDRRRVRYPLVLIGRRPQCALRLLGEIVSSYHCLLFWCEQRLWCIDLASSNGTRVGEALIACRELLLGERLEVGEFQLLYYRWSPRPSTPGLAEEDGSDEHDTLDSSFDVLLDAPAWSEDDDSAVGTSIATMALNQAAGCAPVSEAIAEQRSELVRLRQEIEQERQRAAQEHQQRTEEVLAETTRLAAEKEALAAQRRAWQQERDAQAHELDRLREELQRTDLTLDANSPQPALARDKESSAQVAVQIGRWLEETRFLPAENESRQPAAAVTKFAAQPAPADDNNLLPAAPAAALRRNSTQRGELTSFVSGRLSDIEDTRRQKLVLVWTAVTLTALATAAAFFGIWIWLR